MERLLYENWRFHTALKVSFGWYFLQGLPSERTFMKDLVIVLRPMPFLAWTLNLKITVQDTGHQATTATFLKTAL